jgi:hypothetical protein
MLQGMSRAAFFQNFAKNVRGKCFNWFCRTPSRLRIRGSGKFRPRFLIGTMAPFFVTHL